MLKTEALAFAATIALCASVVTVQAAKRAPGHLKPRTPKATPKAPVPLNMGDQILVNGQVFTISVGLVPATVTPPPPVLPTLTGYSPNPVSGGQPFILQGTNFTDPQATATWNGQTLGLIVTSPTTISTTAPGVTAAITAPVILVTGGTRLTGPPLTVTPSQGPPPDMAIYGYRNSQRDWTNVFAPGQTVFIEGKGFGTLAGTVAVNHRQTPIEAWVDTEIRITCPGLGVGEKAGPCTLDIIRADHAAWNTSVGFTILPPPGKFGNR